MGTVTRNPWRGQGASLLLAGFVFLSVACTPARDAPPAAMTQATDRPDVILIVVDDLRWDEFGAAGHPYLETPNIDRLAVEGALFANAFNVTPLCSPNRASLLTGQYVSRHGILDNVSRSKASHRLQLFPIALQAAGYETAHIGKWHMGNDPTPRPGYDYWSALPGQGRTMDPELFEEGRLHTVEGYVTDVLTDRALAFIQRARTTPYFLYLGHKAIHPDARQLDDGSVDLSYGMRYIPAPRHEGRYEGKTFPRRPNAASSAGVRANKPVVRMALERKDSPEITEQFGPILDPGTSEEFIRRRAEMLLAVDESLGRILAVLEERGTLDRTAIFFTSDNGYFYGEHGLSIERRLPYEEAARAPLLIRYPTRVEAGSHPEELAISIDIAPTVLELAEAEIGPHVQGRSLLPVLGSQTAGWRSAFLMEYIGYENPMPWLIGLGYRVVRTKRYKYIRWIHHEGMDELYDLEADPYEVSNVIDDPAYTEVATEMRAQLARLVAEAVGL